MNKTGFLDFLLVVILILVLAWSLMNDFPEIIADLFQ